MPTNDRFYCDDLTTDDDRVSGIDDLIDVLATTLDPLSLDTLAELLLHPDGRVRSAALEAIERLRPSNLELRRQLTPSAFRRVRRALGWAKTRPTRKARATLAATRPPEDEEEEATYDDADSSRDTS